MRTTFALLLFGTGAFAIALCLAPSAAALDGNDDAGNATAIPPGLNGPFDIDPTGDLDWYSFSLAESSSVRIELNGSSGDSVLYLYDANLTQLAYDDDGGTSLWSRLVRVLVAGDYFARVGELGNSGTIYGYYLTLEVTPPVPLTEGLNGPFNASPAGTQNLFTFDVVETSNVRLELNGSSGDPVMYLFDGNQVQLAYDDDGGAGLWSRIVRQLSPGTYFARVQALSSGSTVLDYYVTLERVSLAGPDGNGVRDNATLLFLGVNGPFDIDPIGDLDWYVITFGSDGIARFQTAAASGATVLSLYDVNGTWLSQDYASGPSSFSLLEATVDASTYFVLVQHAYGSSTLYNYTVEVEISPLPSPDGNGDQANATLLLEGAGGPFSLTRGDIDWYTFAAPTPGTLTVEADGPVGGTALTLFDLDRALVAFGYATGNASFQRVSALVDRGTYLIEVQLPYGLLATSQYNLTVTFTPWTTLDGNDFRSTAQHLSQGINGPYSIEPTADADWYYFDQSDAGTTQVMILGGSGYATVQFYNATGATLAGGTSGYQQVSLTLQPARYFVRITSTYGYYTVASYFLNLSFPDTQAPQIALTGPSNGAQVDKGAVRVSGTTEPGSRVWIDGAEVAVDENGSFSTVVLLAVGSNTVTFLARDPVGNEAQSSISIVGVDPYASLTSQLQQANAQLAAAQAAQADASRQLADASARLNATQSQFDTTNGSLTAARQEADAQRGLALGGMVLAAVGIAAAVAAALLVRRRPTSSTEAAPTAPASAAPATAQVPPAALGAPQSGNLQGSPPTPPAT